MESPLLLDRMLFFSLDHAREALADWKDDYNNFRPHSANNLAPAIYAKFGAYGMQRIEGARAAVGFRATTRCHRANTVMTGGSRKELVATPAGAALRTQAQPPRIWAGSPFFKHLT
jgi:transposase InsO family protein